MGHELRSTMEACFCHGFFILFFFANHCGGSKFPYTTVHLSDLVFESKHVGSTKSNEDQNESTKAKRRKYFIIFLYVDQILKVWVSCRTFEHGLKLSSAQGWTCLLSSSSYSHTDAFSSTISHLNCNYAVNVINN